MFGKKLCDKYCSPTNLYVFLFITRKQLIISIVMFWQISPCFFCKNMCDTVTKMKRKININKT